MKARLIFAFFAALLIAGCSSSNKVFYEQPYEFRFPEKQTEFYNTYTKYIKGKTFFLDPGHGGDDRVSVGFLGLAVEADINLHVALHLRDFLTQAGANVIMSRVKDTTVDLKDRSIIANNSGADYFISIHHNAPGDDNDYWTDYTSTYYHAKPTDYEYEPNEYDLAKYVERDIAYAMRNSGGPGSFDGTYSDYSIFPKAGFSVLRLTKIPAILVECGFFTNNNEERRLVDDNFSKIEAWGIFRGICRYLESGVPVIIPDNNLTIQSSTDWTLNIKDKSAIDSSSIEVKVDSVQYKEFSFEKNTNTLKIRTNNLEPGIHVVKVVAANKNGNHSIPLERKITIIK